jgi:hypothetical protein
MRSIQLALASSIAAAYRRDALIRFTAVGTQGLEAARWRAERARDRNADTPQHAPRSFRSIRDV